MIHEQIIEADGKAFNVAVGPDNGPPLILFHGVTRRWQTFTPLIPNLMTRFQIFAIDFPGHGKSEPTKRGYRVVDYVSYAETLLNTPPFSTQRECFLYGHSLGSMVVAELAGRLGTKVRGAVLEDPPFHTMGDRINDGPLLEYFRTVSELAGAPDGVSATARKLAEVSIGTPTGETVRLGDVRDAAALRFTASCLAQLDPGVFEPIVAGQWLDEYDCPAVLSAIACPTLLLQADMAAAGMLTDSDAAEAEERAADLIRIKYSGSGHMIHEQRTSKLLRHVEAFLESIRV
jgi:pimeloyl-ACP methyl ester carboxylesterase